VTVNFRTFYYVECLRFAFVVGRLVVIEPVGILQPGRHVQLYAVLSHCYYGRGNVCFFGTLAAVTDLNLAFFIIFFYMSFNLPNILYFATLLLLNYKINSTTIYIKTINFTKLLHSYTSTIRQVFLSIYFWKLPTLLRMFRSLVFFNKKTKIRS